MYIYTCINIFNGFSHNVVYIICHRLHFSSHFLGYSVTSYHFIRRMIIIVIYVSFGRVCPFFFYICESCMLILLFKPYFKWLSDTVDFFISWISFPIHFLAIIYPVDDRTAQTTTVQRVVIYLWWHILTRGCPQVGVLDWMGLSMFGRVKTFWGLPWGTFLQRGDGRGGFCCSVSPPTMCIPETKNNNNSPVTELQIGHTRHPRKAFPGHLRQREISCWDPQRDGGELIFLFSRSQIKWRGD